MADKLATKTKRNFKPAIELLTIGTWNVVTLYAGDKLKLSNMETGRRYLCAILGIA